MRAGGPVGGGRPDTHAQRRAFRQRDLHARGRDAARGRAVGYAQLHGPVGCHEVHGMCTCTHTRTCMHAHACTCTCMHMHIACRHSGLRHLRLHSQRPPPTRHNTHAFGSLLTRSEEACAAEQDCQHRFRDHAMIYVDPSALRVALADAAAPAVGRGANNHVLARGARRSAGRRGRGAGRGAGRTAGRDASCTDAVGWSNRYGRSCADYSRRGKASAEGVSSPTAGCRCIHTYSFR